MSTDAKIELRMHAELVRQLRLRCCHVEMRLDDLVAALVLTHMNQRDPSDFGEGLVLAYRNWVAGKKHPLRPWPAEILEAARGRLSPQQQQPAEILEGDQPAKGKRRRRRPATERVAVKPSSRIEALKQNGMRPREGNILTSPSPR